MAIKFKCPHCQKPLSVKDHLAGKRAACPACKKVLTIPQPDPAPAAADLEALAAAALADEPPPAPPPEQETKTLSFNCPQCDAAVTMPLDLAGKRAPCPECRRIIKVPEPVKKEPKDWRKLAAGGPSLARTDTEPAPEGAWGTATSAATVSRQALTEAGVITQREKTPLRTWVLRGAVAAGALLAAGVGTLVAFNLLSAGRQDRAVTQALSLAGDEEKYTPQQRAVVHLAAGEFYLRTGKDDAAQKARDQMQAARSLLVPAPGDERDALLIRLALAQIDLGGDPADVEKGRRIKWEEPPRKGKQQAARQEPESVRAELRRTLENLRDPEARAEGVRAVARKLIEKKQAALLVPLALQLNFRGKNGEVDADASVEAMAVAGLELARAKQDAAAVKLAERAFLPYSGAEDGGKGKRPALSPSLVALCRVLGKPEPPPRKEGDQANADDRDAQLVGQAEALARQDKLPEARQGAAGIRNPAVRFRALAALADRSPPDPADVKAALDVAKGELKGKASPWLLWRLARVAAAAGQADLARQAAAAIPGAGLRGAAQFEAVQAQLAADRGRADEALAAGVEPKSGGAALAWIELARHNARLDAATLKAVQGWDEATRPYGLVGAALGVQD